MRVPIHHQLLNPGIFVHLVSAQNKNAIMARASRLSLPKQGGEGQVRSEQVWPKAEQGQGQGQGQGQLLTTNFTKHVCTTPRLCCPAQPPPQGLQKRQAMQA